MPVLTRWARDYDSAFMVGLLMDSVTRAVLARLTRECKLIHRTFVHTRNF